MNEEPVFPKIYTGNSNRDSIQTGGVPNTWETTYHSYIKPQEGQIEPQYVDTVALQKTHWQGNGESSDMLSETKAKYIQYPIQKKDQIQTRQNLMSTNYADDNRLPMETRESLNRYKVASSLGVSKPTISHQQLAASHIDLKQAGNDDWTTTTGSAYQYHQPDPAKPALADLRSGNGAREAMDNQGAFQVYVSEAHDNYRKFNIPPSQNNNQDLRKTSIRVGGDKVTYETTNKHDFKKISIDPSELESQKISTAQLQRSQFEVGNRSYPTEKSSYQETFKQYPDAQPPKPVEKSAFVSHHDYRNCNETFKSSSQDAYVPLNGKPSRPFNMNLNQSHVKLGENSVHETTSLYNETFKPQSSTIQNTHVDPAEARAFHTRHHANVTTIVGIETNKTINQTSYVPHPESRPREPIRNDFNSNPICMANQSTIQMQSTMKSDFKAPQPTAPNQAVNNRLQNSHLHLGGMNTEWKTTQSDYFQYKTFRKGD